MKYKQHPLAIKYIPAQKPDEFRRLRESLREGFNEHYPIILYEGQVLVGWSRYQAALAEKVEPIFEEYTGSSPVRMILLSELDRRHLSVVQILNLSEAMRPALEEEAKARSQANLRPKTQKSPSFSESANLRTRGTVSEQIAEKAGVSPRTVDSFHKVQVDGTEELKEAVDEEEISISDAAAIADKPAAEQKKAVKAVRAGKAKTIGQAMKEQELRERTRQDELGLPLPSPEAIEAFAARAKFEEGLTLFRQLKRLLNELAQMKGGEQLRRRMQLIERQGKQSYTMPSLDNLASALKDTSPHVARCPYCHHDEPGTPNRQSCSACKGLPYVTEPTWKNAPKDMQESVLETAR